MTIFEGGSRGVSLKIKCLWRRWWCDLPKLCGEVLNFALGLKGGRKEGREEGRKRGPKIGKSEKGRKEGRKEGREDRR
jgi:hypothetical protein